MDLEQIRTFIKKYPIIAYPGIGLLVLGLWSVLMMFFSGHSSKPEIKGSSPKSSTIGVSVGGVDQQAYIARLEKNYYDFEDRVKDVESQIKSIKNLTKDLKLQQKEVSKNISKLEHLNAYKEDVETAGLGVQSLELSIAEIKPLEKDVQDSVYLPIGSFCKGTLLTGVYAAADINNPLPVLIALEEAFYGPNKTRIPLKGAFILGKAYGDLVSSRALIQVVAISTVLPNGHAFEREENLGYISDEQGELGIQGRVIRNTGKELALSFMGGFMSGGAQALADQEVSSTNNALGTASRQVTGNGSKNAIFSGLAKSAGRMSDYYEKQAEDLIPAIHVNNGQTVYFIVQKGVSIDGLPRIDYVHANYMD